MYLTLWSRWISPKHDACFLFIAAGGEKFCLLLETFIWYRREVSEFQFFKYKERKLLLNFVIEHNIF